VWNKPLQYLVTFLTFCIVSFAIGYFIFGDTPNTKFFLRLLIGGVLFALIFGLLRGKSAKE
jgi:cell shape-determining protein MreD